jgi:transposase
VVSDGEGIPLGVHVTAGQTHEAKGFEAVVNAVRIPQPFGRPRTRPFRLAGDKGYDIPRIRQWLRRHSITAIIPEKHKPHGRKPGRPFQFDRDTYRRRNVIERSIGWLKHARRIATRFEKLAVNFLAMLKLAMIQRYFKIYLRDTT